MKNFQKLLCGAFLVATLGAVGANSAVAETDKTLASSTVVISSETQSAVKEEGAEKAADTTSETPESEKIAPAELTSKQNEEVRVVQDGQTYIGIYENTGSGEIYTYYLEPKNIGVVDPNSKTYSYRDTPDGLRLMANDGLFADDFRVSNQYEKVEHNGKLYLKVAFRGFRKVDNLNVWKEFYILADDFVDYLEQKDGVKKYYFVYNTEGTQIVEEAIERTGKEITSVEQDGKTYLVLGYEILEGTRYSIYLLKEDAQQFVANRDEVQLYYQLNYGDEILPLDGKTLPVSEEKKVSEPQKNSETKSSDSAKLPAKNESKLPNTATEIFLTANLIGAVIVGAVFIIKKKAKKI
ncbi:hypothetical protein Hs30E_14960 [Lactococcus hodotermopsidis]|uniref:Doublecortin domain-containing protein n=1 Tax=Pseudolactococcus hodotermopsidis TaxID=2709157 RepID=A0A6A0BE33_9LACT|nr:hypothetical protein [Lactococcus hodotermopsidis]GFH42945.1 hypothetical protein Hs30E_14960 [Lactococcus hodotermopsidis]